MPKREGKRRRPGEGHLSVLRPADPVDDVGIRNRYNEEVHWEILLLEPVNDWFLALCKDDPYKVGRWNAWYAEAIPLAEERYAAYRREADKEEQ